MLASEILKQAKSLLTPETWGKGNDVGRVESPRLCAAQAVDRAVMTLQDKLCTREGLAAYCLLGATATGYNYGGNIPMWNDRPERTLQEVYDAFDAAIVIAEQREQAERADALVTA